MRSLGWAVRAGLDNLLPPRCPLCRRYSLDTGLCAACLTTPPPLELIRALAVYNDISRQLILQFKHGDGLHITPLLVRLMSPLLAGLASKHMLVVPIPLHRARYLKRRYN